MQDNNNKVGERVFPATVAEVLDNYTVVINRGSKDGVRKGMRFVIYRLSEKDIIDPETGESLGKLEIIKGEGEVVHVQPSMSILKSIEKPQQKRIIRDDFRQMLMFPKFKIEEEIMESIRLPFDNVEVGDKAKPI